MWIRNEDRREQEILDEVEISGTLWVEIPDPKEKGGNDVQSKDTSNAGKETIPA